MTRRAIYDYAASLDSADLDLAEYWRGRSEESNQTAGEVFSLLGYTATNHDRLYRLVRRSLDAEAEKIDLQDPLESEQFYMVLDRITSLVVSRCPIQSDYDFVQAVSLLKGLHDGDFNAQRVGKTPEGHRKDDSELATQGTETAPVLTAWYGGGAF